MAIHPDYPGLSAEVIVDGDPLTEYRCDDNDVEDQPNTFTQYVQVDSDVNFSVRYTIPQGLYGAYGVRSNIKIDGKSVSSHNHNYEQVARRDVTKWVNTVYGTDSGMNYTYKLRFSKLDIGQSKAHIFAFASNHVQTKKETSSTRMRCCNSSAQET
jgi:hypothetical protein